MSFQRVTFNGVNLGDHAYVSPSYQGNVVQRIIPRASGARIYDTKQMGGGIITLTVHAFVIKTTRKSLEQYFYNLQGNLGAAKASLVIEDWTLEDCSIESYSMENEGNENFSKFTLTLTKSV